MEEFPPEPEENNIWITYEGRVGLDDKASLYIELSMLPSNAVGEGFYHLKEVLEPEAAGLPLAVLKGKYSTIIQLHNSVRSPGLTRTYQAPGFRGNITDSHLTMIREEPFRAADLTLKLQAKHKLIVLDDRLQVVSDDPAHNLVSRTSRPFTIEGYFRHNGDSADFSELNTGEVWAVSKYGDYPKAIRQYHQLTTEKFELTYLKGIGFSIRHVNKEGTEIDALVIKKVLQMTATSDFEENDP